MKGYKRKDGRFGIRNSVQVVFLVECAHFVAKKIATTFNDTDIQYFGFSGCYPSDYGYRLVHGLTTHPNVGAVLLVSLGCECFDRKRLESEILTSGRLCKTLVIQENKGTSSSIKLGVEWVKQAKEKLNKEQVHEINFSDLVIGTVCGGSDGTSAITGNPAVGKAFDYLISQNAACVFEESGELIGCEMRMFERARNEKVRQDIEYAMLKAQQYYTKMGLGSFSEGNAVGGLTTQEEKSLGAYAKSGDSEITAVIKPTVQIDKPGLYFMDVVPDGEPLYGYPNICDTAEFIELISSGCHIILFTTGRGSVAGSVIAPVIKICNNPVTYKNMSEDMDVNAGKIIEDNVSLDEIGQEIVRCVESVSSGNKSKGEALGHSEFVLTYKQFDYIDCKLES